MSQAVGPRYASAVNALRIVVVGTGTEVGKTHVTGCLLAESRAKGRKVRAYKPIATGVDGRCDDAEAHGLAAGAPYVHPTFAYRRPVSPHLAARDEARPIDLTRIRQCTDELALLQDAVIVETAGGLLTPLSDTLVNADLVDRISPARVVLVAPDRLGVLHDVGACLAAARARGIAVAALVLSTPGTPDASTGCNARELDRLGLGPVVGVFPRATTDADESQQVARRVWAALNC